MDALDQPAARIGVSVASSILRQPKSCFYLATPRRYGRVPHTEFVTVDLVRTFDPI